MVGLLFVFFVREVSFWRGCFGDIFVSLCGVLYIFLYIKYRQHSTNIIAIVSTNMNSYFHQQAAYFQKSTLDAEFCIT